jgi:hypothetical protein
VRKLRWSIGNKGKSGVWEWFIISKTTITKYGYSQCMLKANRQILVKKYCIRLNRR